MDNNTVEENIFSGIPVRSYINLTIDLVPTLKPILSLTYEDVCKHKTGFDAIDRTANEFHKRYKDGTIDQETANISLRACFFRIITTELRKEINNVIDIVLESLYFEYSPLNTSYFNKNGDRLLRSSTVEYTEVLDYLSKQEGFYCSVGNGTERNGQANYFIKVAKAASEHLIKRILTSPEIFIHSGYLMIHAICKSIISGEIPCYEAGFVTIDAMTSNRR